jgi:hypothetical protein
LFIHFSLFFTHSVTHGVELELKMLVIQEAVDVVAGYVHAHGGSREECLLDIPNCVRDTVEFGVHRGAAVALMVVQVRLRHVLHHLVGLLEGQEPVNHDGSREDFDEVADAVVDLVLTKKIV